MSGSTTGDDLGRTDRNARTILALVVAIGLLTFPLYGSRFLILQIGAQSLFLAIIAMSLIFLAGFGGMLSLAQMTLYGLAGYAVGIVTVTHGKSVWLAIPAALGTATIAALLFGLIAIRTQGIYFLMITLALGMVVFYFTNQNYTIFNGHTGINGVRAPAVGGVDFRDATPFYYLALVMAALVYAGLTYILRSPFGLAVQGARDNPRRMQALGYWVPAHRVAAFALAGFVAGIGGVLGVWYNGAIAPSSIDVPRIINILVIAVIGGIGYLEGAFLGALAFTLVNNYASSYTDRYNTAIGLSFLLIVLFSPDGLIGLARRAPGLLRRPGAGRAATPQARPGPNSATPDPVDPAVEG